MLSTGNVMKAIVAGLAVAVLVAAATAPASVRPLTAAARSGPSPDVFISPSGSDSARCTRSAPCRTFDRAFRAATPGATVEVAGGRYDGQQEIPAVRGRSGAPVVFRPAPGARVVADALDVYGSNVEIRNVTIERDFYVKCGADRVTLRGSRAGILFIRSATNIRIVRSEFGPWENSVSQIGSGNDCDEVPRNIVLERVYMHDFHSNPFNSVHEECLMVTGVKGLVIRESRFHRCEDFDILFKRFGTEVELSDITLENNWFNVPYPDGTSAIQFSSPGGGTYTNVLIRNNSFAGTLTIKPDNTYRNFRVIGNVGTNYGGLCGRGVETGFNVWARGACRGDRTAAPGYRDQARFDFHLAPGSRAIGFGHPKSFPARDIDGHKRPRGGRADAGADEFR